MIKLPIIVGPTCSGKTRLACEVCSLVQAEVVSADSRQVYKLMDIGTAKPSRELRTAAPHHLIDVVYPDEDYSAADYARDAQMAIDDLLARKKIPLLVGGSGLYIGALVDRFFEAPKADRQARQRLLEEADVLGPSVLHQRLQEVDPEAASRIHPKDLQRVVRALEVYQQTGVAISRLQLRTPGGRFSPLYLGLLRERTALYRRIEERLDKMMEEGFVGEVESLLEAGYSPQLNSFSAVGYREIADHLAGKTELKAAVRLIERNTRRYAKRQLTWFQGVEGIRWIELPGEKDVRDLARHVAAAIRDFLAG